MDSKTTYIYSLSHPITGEVRYVGKADHPKIRHIKHLKDSSRTRKTNWIRHLKINGLAPVLEIIEEVEKINWAYWERFYIVLFKSWGFNLTNSNEGGEGNPGYSVSEETRQKLRIVNIGKRHTEETKAKMKMSSSRFWLGKKRSEEDRRKVSVALTGKKQSLETINRRSKAISGEKHPLFGKQLTKDHKAKLWLKRDRTVSDETRRKTSISIKEVWRKRKEAKCQAA